MLLKNKCLKCNHKSKARKLCSQHYQQEMRATNSDYRYRRILSKAKERNLKFEIIKEDWLILKNRECFYCHKKECINSGTGLDRLDNSKGYSIENTIPCCTACNRIRGDNLTPEEMIIAMDAVIKFRNK